MGPSRIEFEPLNRILREMGARGKSVYPLLPKVGEALIAAVSDVYEAEGPGWEPLSPNTRRKSGNEGAKLLRDFGIMAASTEAQTGPEWVEAVAGTDYAEFHATGTENMPQRNPFELGEFMDDVLDDVADMLMEEVLK